MPNILNSLKPLIQHEMPAWMRLAAEACL